MLPSQAGAYRVLHLCHLIIAPVTWWQESTTRAQGETMPGGRDAYKPQVNQQNLDADAASRAMHLAVGMEPALKPSNCVLSASSPICEPQQAASAWYVQPFLKSNGVC